MGCNNCFYKAVSDVLLPWTCVAIHLYIKVTPDDLLVWNVWLQRSEKSALTFEFSVLNAAGFAQI